MDYAEQFYHTLLPRLKVDYPTTKIYISTANPYNNWIECMYKFKYYQDDKIYKQEKKQEE